MYKTSDPASLKEFFNQTDILVCSLPSTPSTTHLLTAEHLSQLRHGAIMVNIGRGDLIRSEELLKALEGDHLYGCALDVTDPEPLPDGHPLFTHPKVTITPHTSGDVIGYNDNAAGVFLVNVERLRNDEEMCNVTNPEKGY
jgi:phosphoglycerate dehydrogenase-like enzyme